MNGDILDCIAEYTGGGKGDDNNTEEIPLFVLINKTILMNYLYY